jgi:hypothetical protein
MLRKFWRPETGIFLGIWLVLLVGGRSRFLHDPGTFWHTVVGGQLLSGHLVYTDTFSFTFAGRYWIPHQWLGECIMAVIHRWDGLDTLLLVTVTLLALLYTVAAARLIRAGLHWSLSVLLVGLTIAASSSHFHIRPHIGTILFLGWTMLFLCDFEAGRMALSRLWWLVPMYWLWSSIHGGMLGGLATIVLAVAGWTFAKLIGRESPLRTYRQLVPLAGILLACGIVPFVNPYGWRMPGMWQTIMSSPVLPQIIQEHAPLDPSKPDGWIVLVFGVVYVFMLAGTLPRWPRVTWLLPLVWFVLADKSIRHAPLFAIVGVFAISDVLPYTRWARWLARPGSDLYQFPPPEQTGHVKGWNWRPALLPIAVVVAALLLQLYRVPVPVLGHGWAEVDRDYWPVDLRTDLERFEHQQPGGTPIFNEYLYGGFLIYYAPGYRVLVDDRCEFYGDTWLQAYVQGELQGTDQLVAQWERAYPPFALALTKTDSGYDRYFRSRQEWQVVRRTDTATLYERTRSAAEAAAGRRPAAR